MGAREETISTVDEDVQSRPAPILAADVVGYLAHSRAYDPVARSGSSDPPGTWSQQTI